MSASLPPLIPTADLCDDYPDCVPFRPSGLPLLDYGGVKHFQGHAVTVRCFQDNSLAAKVLDEPGMSRVLVVDGQGSLACALFGDMMASKAVKNGWAGVVVNGAIRDVSQLAGMPLGVKALGTCPKKSLKAGRGDRDVPLDCFDVRILPNSFIVCDHDGCVVLPRPPQPTSKI
jgi:regulator of ribonuclease activity A